MVSLTAIRRVEVQGSAKGLDSLERSLQAVGTAQERLARTGEVVARTTDKAERRQLSLAGTYERVRQQLDSTYRAQLKFDSYQQAIDRSFQQGAISAQEYDRDMGLLRAKFDVVGSAAEKAAARVHELKMRFDEGYAAAARMDQELADLAEAERAGVQITGGYANAIDALAQKHDKAGQAAQRHAQELRELADAERLSASSADGQAKWNSYAGVGRNNAGSARDSAAVFEAAAREADEMSRSVASLRAQIDPLGAAQDRLNGELAEYQALAARGAISSAELAKAQALAQQRFATVSATVQRYSAAANEGAHNTANLAAQFQDIAVTSAMGMSPLQIALQQGTQISAVLGPMGAAGAVRSLGAAFLSIISPTALVTIGLVAAAAAAIQYFTSTEEESKTSNDLLRRHGELISALREAYGEAASGLDVYTRKSRGVLQAEALIMGDKLKAELKTFTDALVSSEEVVGNAMDTLIQKQSELRDAMAIEMDPTALAAMEEQYSKLSQELLSSSTVAESATAKFGPFASAIDTFAESARQGLPDYLALRDAVSQQINADPSNQSLRALGAELLELIGKGADVQAAMQQGAAGISLLGNQAAASSGSVATFASALAELGRQVPQIARAQAAQAAATKNLDLYRQGLAELDRQMSSGSLRSEDAYIRKRRELEGVFKQAQIEVSGLGEATRDLQRTERQAQIGAMAGRDADIARIRDKYEELTKSLRETGASQSDLDRATASMNSELAVSAQRFDEMERKAGERGAAKGLRDADKAARELQQSMESLRGRADGLVEQLFPGEAARREAEELISLLAQYGDGLDDVQRKAVELRIADQFEAARRGVRELDQTTKNSAESMAQSVEQTLGSVLGDLFSKPMRDLDAFIESVMSQFAQLGQANLQKFFDGFFSGSGSSGAGASSRGGGLFGQIADFVGGIFGNSKVMGAQNRAINTAASQISVKPLVSAMGEIGDAVSRTTSTLGSSMSQYANAIKSIESSGNYGALGPVTAKGDRAYGAYQVMGNNIPSWTKELLGYSISATDFLKSRSIQDAVFQQQFKKSIDKFGNFSDAASVWFTGRPASAAAGSNDGYIKVEEYIRRANSSLANPSAISSAVEAGTKNGLTAIATAGANAGAGAGAGDPWAGLRQATAPGVASPSGSSGAMGNFGGIAGAALGGLGMGFQSQNPAMGGIGGALSGFMSGGLPGAVIGGIAGIIGGIFGRNRAKKQEQSQARNQLNANKTLLAQLFAAGDGRGTGSASQAYNDFYDRTAEVDLVAQKAGDDELVQKLRNNVNKFFLILEKDFIAKFPGIAEAYSSGYGSDSPFMQGVSAMEDLREELKNFVADARDFGELQLKHARDLTPEQLEERVAEAERAAQKMVLASITGVRELGAMEAEMLRLEGSASVAQQSLEQLGMSAQDAANAVAGALGVAIAKMKDMYLQDVSASLNSLSGVGYLNDILDAQIAYQERLADASALGLSGSYAMQELSLSLKDIVSSASLTKQEVDALALAFPSLAGMLRAGLDTSSVSVDKARSDLQAAYDEESSALKETKSRLEQFTASIKQFRSQMVIGSNSPLSPEQRLLEAQRQFRETAAKAATGDETAMNDLTSISQAYLDAAKGYYASTAGYVDIWNEVSNTLDQTQKAAEGQLSETEKQLKALDDQVKGILDVNTSVMSVKDAIDQFNSAQSAHLQALSQQLAELAQIGRASITAAYQTAIGRTPTSGEVDWWQGQIKDGKTVDQVTDAIGNSKEAQLNALYRQIMGRDIDTASRSYWLGSGKTLEQIAADLRYAKANGGYALGGIVGRYAAGGIIGNGVFNVDSVMARYAGGGNVMLAGGEHVTRATSVNNATYSTLDYINRTGRVPGNDEGVSREIQRLQDLVKILTGRVQELTAVTEESGRAVANAASGTTQAVQQMGKTASVQGRNRSKAA